MQPEILSLKPWKKLKLLLNLAANPVRRAVYKTRAKNNLYRHGKDLACAFSHNIYGAYCVPMGSSHRPASKAVLAHRVYEPDTIKFMTENCANGDIIHAGTFFGDFLPALSKAVSANAKIWAFEPNPENFRCAQITAFINDLKNVELANSAVGEQNDMASLAIHDTKGRSLGGASKVITDQGSSECDAVVTVQVKTIDGIVPRERAISIIQLDVEGYEIAALKGVIEIIEKWRPILILEVLSGVNFENDLWFHDNILAMGYSINRILHGNYVYKSI